MIQWLQSKLVLILAGMILVSSVTAVFHYQLESMEREELENLCGKISRVIQKMDRADVEEMRQRITFEQGSEGIYLSPLIRGDPYTIEIRTEFVKIEKDGETAIESLQANVHLWGPGEMNDTHELNEEEKNWRDSQTPSLEIHSEKSEIELRRIELSNGDVTQPHIFISEVEIA